MIKRNYSRDFRFICYTDNPDGLECETLEIPDDGLLHPKYYFGKEKFCFDRAKFLVFNSENWLSNTSSEDKFCYFDLDLVIQNNINDIDILAEKPRIITPKWQSPRQMHDRFFIETRGTFYNSSMLLWSYGQCQHIYKDVIENGEIVFKTFIKGSDNYHFWRQRRFWKNIPEDWVYSWNRGKHFPDDVDGFKFRRDAKICLFNTDNVPHPSAKAHIQLHECEHEDIIRLWNGE